MFTKFSVKNGTAYDKQLSTTAPIAIPAKPVLVLDLAKIAEAQAQADYILHTIFGK